MKDIINSELIAFKGNLHSYDKFDVELSEIIRKFQILPDKEEKRLIVTKREKIISFKCPARPHFGFYDV